MSTFAERVIEFNRNLTLDIRLPDSIKVMNPFLDSDTAFEVSSQFYRKFYNDNKSRRIILGINPGRFGAGVTGIPFTDTKRLKDKCGITLKGITTHEPSSVFVYDVIEAYGGTERFFSEFYINSPSPLGYVKTNEKGANVNFNYYDNREMEIAVRPFIINSLKQYLEIGIKNDIAFCLGSGKNFKAIRVINDQYRFFEKLIPLEHPRYIMQYKSSTKSEFIDKYLIALSIAP